jgi:hypothetical protein
LAGVTRIVLPEMALVVGYADTRSLLLAVLIVSSNPLRATNDGSYISLRPFCARSDGAQTCTAIVKVFDDIQTPLSGQSVTLISSRGASDIIGPANPQTTDANGQVTFTIRSSVRGSSTLTATCNGQTISKGIIQDGAVGIWSFEASAKDLSGSGTIASPPMTAPMRCFTSTVSCEVPGQRRWPWTLGLP